MRVGLLICSLVLSGQFVFGQVTSLANGTVGQAYTGGNNLGGLGACSLVVGTLPPGLSPHSTTTLPSLCTIVGTPTTAGTYQFTLRFALQSGNKAYQIIINSAPPLYVIGPEPSVLPKGTVGVAYTPVSFSAVGGTGVGYTFTVSGLPSGLILHIINGELSQVPDIEGTPLPCSQTSYMVTVAVRDSANNTNSRTWGLTINGCVVGAPLTITTQSLPSGNVSTSYSATLSASGGTTPYTWAIAAGSLPSGLTLNASTGVISGTPTVVGVTNAFKFTVRVTDSSGNTMSAPLSIQVFGIPSLIVSPTMLNLSAQTGATSQTLPLHISVNTVDSIRVKVDTNYQKGTGWLSAGPTGSLDYSISGNASALSADNYTATLTVSCVGQTCSQSPAIVSVMFSVTPGALTVSARALVFPAIAGRISTPETLTVASSGGPLPFTTAADPWIIVNPASGTASSTPQPLSVSVDATSLSVGQHTGTLTVSCASCSPWYVMVTANVASPNLSVTPPTLTFQATAPNGTLPSSQMVNVTASDSEGFLFTYSPQGSWLKVNANQTTTPAVLTANVVSIPGQTSSGSITITPANGSGAIMVQVTITVTGAIPSISANGVVSASAFGEFASIAPGTYIEIYGSNLSSTNPGRSWTCADFTNNCQNAPTALDDTRVTIGNSKAFVAYVSTDQVNALIPSDVGTGPMQVTVTNTTGTSTAYTLTVNQVQPGLLAPSSFKVGGKQYVAALVSNPQSFALPIGALPGVASRPAKPGEILVLYGIGFGPVIPAIPAGTVVSQSNTLGMPLQILFGSTPANIVYDGLAPNFTGLYQFNVQVPQIPDGDAVPLKFNLGGVSGTQTLYVAVHQ